MTTRRHLLAFAVLGATVTLALIAALAALALAIGVTPATSTPGAQDRVGAFLSAAPTHHTRADCPESSCTRPSSIAATPRIAADCCVATKVGAGAQKAFVASDGTEIIGFTRHGINRAIGDDAKRAGVRPEALLDAIKNPTKIAEGVDDLGRPFKVYRGADARVVINPETGRIVSMNPRTGAGANR